MPEHREQLLIDQKGILRRRLGARAVPACGGEWLIDHMASCLPWHRDRAGAISLTDDMAVMFCRLAVARAHEDGRDALARERGHRERSQVARRGLSREIDPLIAMIRRPGTPLAEAGEVLGRRLGVTRQPGEVDAALAVRIRQAGHLPAGRAADVEAVAFIRSLAGWWWRQTGKRPSARRADGPRDPDRRRHRAPSFYEFVEAAWTDAGGAGSISRCIRTAIATMPSPPWRQS